MDLAEASAADFQPLVEEKFSVAGGDIEYLTLTEVEVRPSPEGAPRQGFSLLFRCDSGVLLSQGIFSLEHPATGALDIFLVPVGQEGQTVSYQAVFA